MFFDLLSHFRHFDKILILLRTCLKISIKILFYQREFIWELVWTWHTFLLLTFDLYVHICSLNQIFSLCYLFFRHASYIIFDFHRDERCKLHIRSHRQRVERNATIQFVTIVHLQHEIFLNSQWRWFTVSCTANLSYKISEINWHSIKLSVKTNCSSKYASR